MNFIMRIKKYYLIYVGMMLCGLLIANNLNAFIKTNYTFNKKSGVIRAS